MSIKKHYLDKFIRATEQAAIGAYPFIGKGDKIAADQGSVDKMRKELNLIQILPCIILNPHKAKYKYFKIEGFLS